MDVKIEYKLATRQQILKTFLRFFETRFASVVDSARPPLSISSIKREEKELPRLADEEIKELAEQFARYIPENTFSLAQVQGFLLTKKIDPRGAVENVENWVKEQIEEKEKIEELKAKKRKRRQELKKQREQEAAERTQRVKISGNENSEAESSAQSDDSQRDEDSEGS